VKLPSIAALTIGIGLSLTLTHIGHAQNILEKLVNPGPLIEGHKKFEKSCTKCHKPFSKKAQSSLCLDCHKKVAGDIKDQKGFHFFSPFVKNQNCKHCHTDHKGRVFDIVKLDPETFNHDFTDFHLKGVHKTARCSSCHLDGKKFRDAPSNCVSCHKKIEPHFGRLGEKCADCHSETAWRPAKKFDHDKTKFPLKDAHIKVACKSCHRGEKYKDIGTQCMSCHDIQDVHRGNFGLKCDSCHAPGKWKTISFDHGRETKFPLNGAHKKAKCKSCHTGDLYKDKLKTTCISCHKKDDKHSGQLGVRCESCHNESDWKRDVLFDHDLTRFPLLGRHARAKCKACHATPAFKDAPTNCASCHKDKHHQGRLGARCESCHNAVDWLQWTFDHARQTDFVLTGAHISTHCHACHARQNVEKVSAPTNCNGCHSADDVHRGGFGRNCERCHSTTSFKQMIRR